MLAILKFIKNLYTGKVPLFSTLVSIGGTVLAIGLAINLTVTKLKVMSLESDLKDSSSEVTRLTGELENCKGRNDILGDRLTFQNDQIKLLINNGSIIEEAVKESQNHYLQSYNNILNAINRKQYVVPEGCEASSAWLKEQAIEQGRDWK